MKKVKITMTEMSNTEIRRFLMQSTFTGKLATVKKDHMLQSRLFVLAGSNSRGKRVGDIIFTTSSTSVKAKNIQRDNRVSTCVDDQTPRFSFVTVYGTAKVYHYRQNKLFEWATN